MIFLDVTNSVRSSHRSGLMRVSSCLRSALARRPDVKLETVVWSDGGWKTTAGSAVIPSAADWLLTPEVFGPDERRGFAEWLSKPGCRTAAVYYDAIPLKLPAITWPRSVGRHPGYMKQLARFDRVLAISNASRAELLGYWDWMRAASQPPVTAFPLGADGDGEPRATHPDGETPGKGLLMVGIVEPRKNQTLMLDVCEELWGSGLEFELHIVGRLNPHYGKPIADRTKNMARRHRGLRFHGQLQDKAVCDLRARCRAAVFPSLAEGNGLPVLEALWHGLPCLCSRIPALEENAAGGGCVLLPVADRPAWVAATRAILSDDAQLRILREQALSRSLPTWDDSAAAVAAVLSA